jgi:hypothetical protein
MRPSLSILLAIVLTGGVATAQPTVKKLPNLIVMTPSPTQKAPPGLRMRTMVRPADKLWIGVDIPAHVPLQVDKLTIDLLDSAPGGGWVATYRQPISTCLTKTNCEVVVKVFDKKAETASVPLNTFMSRPEHLEVQDVRYADGTVYFNEACQSYSKEAGGKCSSLVAVDPIARKVLWRTANLVSNNYFLVLDKYIVAAYSFTGEKGNVRVIRRSDGKVMDAHPIAHNFEMQTSGDRLSIEMYYTDGTANFTMTGFEGASPKLTPLPNTPVDPNDKPKPYNPPLFMSSATPF